LVLHRTGGVPASRGRVLRTASLLAVLLVVTAGPSARGLPAQDVSTAAIAGSVLDDAGVPMDGVRVSVVSEASGFVVETVARHGRFLVPGLPVGTRYIVTVRHEGYRRQQVTSAVLALGDRIELAFHLDPAPVLLEPVTVTAAAATAQPGAHGGLATTVGDSVVHRLPSLNRNLYDFVRIAPQVTTRIGFEPGGMSGGGAGFRFNNFLIDGLPERSIGGNQPLEFAGGRSLPLEAVQEFQVLTAPFDVRYGDFTGALVNAVTRAGTNRFAGSAFVRMRNDALARQGAHAPANPFERWQYGFHAGGPVVRDRVHFFIAAEVQAHRASTAGPFIGQPDDAVPVVPVSAADIARFDAIMREYGLTAGSGGAVRGSNPLANVHARLDAALPRNARLVIWGAAAGSRNVRFSRPDRSPFPLSTQKATQHFSGGTLAAQLHTTLSRRGGGHNELSISRRQFVSGWNPDVRQPIVRVFVPGTGGGTVALVSGAARQAHGGAFRTWDLNLRDNLTLPFGDRHTAVFGVEGSVFSVRSGTLLNAWGTWTFSSLDSLAVGAAHTYELARDYGSAGVPLRGAHYAVYVGDRWRAASRLTVTAGLRGDLLDLRGGAPYNAEVDSLFGRRTDLRACRSPHLSPRLGFVWDVSGDARHQLRGGAGVFTGRPPLAWHHSARTGYGLGTGTLRCGTPPGTLGPAPAFTPDTRAPPQACGDGTGLAGPPRGEVNLIAPGLRMARSVRGVLAYDRRFGADVTASAELSQSWFTSDFVFVNLNLGEPRGTDPYGRVLYGSISPDGRSHPTLVADSFPSVVELRNTGRNRATQAAVRLERRFTRGSSGTVAYTFTRVRDASTPLRTYVEGTVNWASTAVSGRHDDLRPGTSLNDVPHRVVAAATWRAPWRSTDIAVLYVGESGSPFTYVAWGAGGRGDLNADGSTTNDPIYVPRDALDPAEIIIDGLSTEAGADNSPAAQLERELRRRTAFEQLIRRTPCLRRQRGRILARNSCREPWAHTTVASIRQAVRLGRHQMDAQLEAFNLLNLIRRDWGQYRVAIPQLLEHTGQTPEAPGQSRPILRAGEHTAQQWVVVPTASSFQLQLGVRYRF
jgi:hypothetical protein